MMDGQVASLYITIMPLPTGIPALVGRDVLTQFGVVLTSDKVFH